MWGLQHGPQRDEVDLSFSIPSECARDVENGAVQVGLVPVAEIARQGLEIVPGVGITCKGAVRSILLFTKVPWKQIRTLAADLSSRTSVELARVILRERYGAAPHITRERPVLDEMLAHSDAALIIGDPALQLDPASLPYDCLDLGAEWWTLTRLPFVFASWAGKPGIPINPLRRLLAESYQFGKEHLDEIVQHELARRGVSRDLAEQYLRHHIRFEIGPKEEQGLRTFFELAHLAEPSAAAAGHVKIA